MGPTHDTPPGLRAQVAAVIAAVRGLVGAHLELAKAELSEIVAEVGRLVGAGCVALALAILAAMLLGIGGILFLGEWLFGSIGWGVLHGVLLLLDLGFLLILVGLRVEGGRIGRGLLIALGLGLVVGFAFATDLTHVIWVASAGRVAPDIGEAVRPTIVAVLSLAVVGLVVGAIVAARSKADRAGGAFAGIIAGALLGLVTAASFGAQVGAAVGVLTTLVAWPILAGLDLSRTGIDIEALKARFIPRATIDTMKETAEWVRARTPLGPRS